MVSIDFDRWLTELTRSTLIGAMLSGLRSDAYAQGLEADGLSVKGRERVPLEGRIETFDSVSEATAFLEKACSSRKIAFSILVLMKKRKPAF